jgi:hypothetical protein
MASRKRISVTTRCVANTYAGPNERIIEFCATGLDVKGPHGQAGAGGLLSFRLAGGKVIINVYGCDKGIYLDLHGRRFNLDQRRKRRPQTVNHH